MLWICLLLLIWFHIWCLLNRNLMISCQDCEPVTCFLPSTVRNQILKSDSIWCQEQLENIHQMLGEEFWGQFWRTNFISSPTKNWMERWRWLSWITLSLLLWTLSCGPSALHLQYAMISVVLVTNLLLKVGWGQYWGRELVGLCDSSTISCPATPHTDWELECWRALHTLNKVVVDP